MSVVWRNWQVDNAGNLEPPIRKAGNILVVRENPRSALDSGDCDNLIVEFGLRAGRSGRAITRVRAFHLHRSELDRSAFVEGSNPEVLAGFEDSQSHYTTVGVAEGGER